MKERFDSAPLDQSGGDPTSGEAPDRSTAPIGRRRLIAAGAAGLAGLAAAPAMAQQRRLAPSGLNPEPNFPLRPRGLAPERTIRDLRHMLAERAGSTRRLSLYNAHTDEQLTATYFQDGEYRGEALAQLNHFMRDWRVGQITRMDPGLFDVITALTRLADTRQPLIVLSGYRTPQTNAALARTHEGVAVNSYHMHGMAVDVTLPGYSLSELHRMALNLGAGGVGYYPANGFLHVDTGPVRRWG